MDLVFAWNLHKDVFNTFIYQVFLYGIL